MKNSVLQSSQYSKNLTQIIQHYSQFGFTNDVIYQAWRNTKYRPQGIIAELQRLQDVKNKTNKNVLTNSSYTILQQDEGQRRAYNQNMIQREEQLSPEQCIRQNNDPVGLRNLGQTCYFNVIIQSLLNIREIRDHILKLDFDKEVKSYNEKYEKVLREFQQLFATMLKGKKSFQDPTNLFNALKEQDQEAFKIGEQNDFFEFQNIIFEMLEKAFDRTQNQDQLVNQSQNDSLESEQSLDLENFELMAKKKPKNQKNLKLDNPITNYLYGQCQESIKFGDKTTNFTETPLGIINLEAQHGDLYKALQSYTQIDIDDYQTEDGKVTKAQINLKIKQCPQILNFYINRLGFDRNTLQPVKNNNFFKFEKEIYMDKFLSDYQEISSNEKDKSYIDSLNKKIEKLENILKDWDNYGSESLKLESCLTNIIEFLEKQTQKDDFVEIDDYELNVDDITQFNGFIGLVCNQQDQKTTLKTLTDYLDKVKNKKSLLEQQLEQLKERRNQIYSEGKSVKYELFSILVHEGNASSGHYFCYIYEEKTQCWWQYNDRIVTKVNIDTILDEVYGREKSTRNCCSMFYRKVDNKVESKKQLQFTARLNSMIKSKNQEFQDELDRSIVKKEFEEKRVMINKKIKELQKPKQNFEKYADFEDLIYQSGDQTLAYWHIIISNLSQVNLSQLKDKVPKQVIENVNSSIFQSMLQQYQVPYQKIEGKEEERYRNLKKLHEKSLNIMKQLGKIFKNTPNHDLFDQNLKQMAALKLETSKFDNNQMKTDLGGGLIKLIDALTRVYILKGCFYLDYYLQKELNATEVQQRETISNIAVLLAQSTVYFYSEDSVFIKQIIENMLSTRDKIYDKELQQFIMLQLDRMQKPAAYKSILVSQIDEIFGDIKEKMVEEEKYVILKELKDQLDDIRTQQIKLWWNQLMVIQKEKQIIPQQIRLDQEEILYFNLA